MPTPTYGCMPFGVMPYPACRPNLKRRSGRLALFGDNLCYIPGCREYLDTVKAGSVTAHPGNVA